MAKITLSDTLPKTSKYSKLDIYNILKQHYLNGYINQDEEYVLEEVEDLVIETRFALIENYSPSSPGWMGDVLLIIPSGGLYATQVITLNDKVANKDVYLLTDDFKASCNTSFL